MNDYQQNNLSNNSNLEYTLTNRKKEIIDEFKKLSKSNILNGKYGFTALVSEGPSNFINYQSYESIFYKDFGECYKEYLEFEPVKIYKYFKNLHVVNMIYKTETFSFSVGILNDSNDSNDIDASLTLASASDSFLSQNPIEKKQESIHSNDKYMYKYITKDEQMYYEKKWNKFNKKKICNIAAENGWLDLLKWAREKNYYWDYKTCDYATKNGHLHILIWAKTNGLNTNFNLLNSAVENGHLKIIKWLRLNGCQWSRYYGNSPYECAAKNGYFDVIKWIYEDGFHWYPERDDWVCAYAAQYGRLDILKWAREKKCYWDRKTCAYAAKNGHLEIIKWAREQENGSKAEWDSWTCSSAALNNHLNVLKWARENGCEWDEWTYIYAAQNNHLDILKWIKENASQTEWDDWTNKFKYINKNK